MICCPLEAARPPEHDLGHEVVVVTLVALLQQRGGFEPRSDTELEWSDHHFF